MSRGWTLLVLGAPGDRARSLFVSRRVVVLLGALLLGACAAGGGYLGWQARGLLGAHLPGGARPSPRAPEVALPRAPEEHASAGDSLFPLPSSPRERGQRPTPGAQGNLMGLHLGPSRPGRASPARATTGLKVVVIGIDGATFRVMKPLLDQQQLPSFQQVIRHGAKGILKSIRPMRSPSLWTSMVTGRERGAHGIIGFLNADDRTGDLVSVHDRRVPALWNILTSFGLESGIVGWWVTWPAESVQGYIVSDRTVRSRWTEWKGGVPVSGRTYPESLAEEIEPFVVNPARPPMSEIDALVSFTDRERAQFVDASRPILGHGPSVFKFAHCAQRSYEEMAAHLLETRAQPDFFALFLGANDAVSHTFWHDYEPRRFPYGIDPDEASRLGKLIPNYYRHNDEVLGRIGHLLGPETVLFIVSDHGFKASGHLPEVHRLLRHESLSPLPPTAAPGAPSEDDINVGQTGIHQEDGILIAAGGPVRKGITVGASIYDITPTILALLGLPVGTDMPGRVLEELVDPAFWRAHPIRTVDSYDALVPLRHPGEAADRADPLLYEQLRSLGYLGADPGGDPNQAPAP